MQIETIFGVALHAAAHTLPADVAGRLATSMTAAAAALRQGAPAAVAAVARRDAVRYLAARRRGDLRLADFAARRACDDAARAVLQLTLDAPPARATAAQLVA